MYLIIFKDVNLYKLILQVSTQLLIYTIANAFCDFTHLIYSYSSRHLIISYYSKCESNND